MDETSIEVNSKILLPSLAPFVLFVISQFFVDNLIYIYSMPVFLPYSRWWQTTGVSIYAKSIKLPSARPGGGGRDGEEWNHQQSSSGPEDSSSHLLETRINLVLVDSSGKPIYKELLPHYVSPHVHSHQMRSFLIHVTTKGILFLVHFQFRMFISEYYHITCERFQFPISYKKVFYLSS